MKLKWNDHMLDNGCLEMREWILMLRVEFRAMIVFSCLFVDKDSIDDQKLDHQLVSLSSC